MQIILLEKVANLGNLGDVVNVKSGYARNFLIPTKQARRATEVAKKEFELKRAELEKIASEKLAAAQALGDKLSGKGSMTLDVTVRGDTVGAAKRSLNGTLAFNLVDGAVKGFNLGKLLRDGQAMLALQSGAGGGTAPSTDFAELRGGGTFVNGVLKSDQLTAKNPLIRLEGAGELNLVSETIDYLAKPTLVNTASGQGGKERADLSGIIVPIRITGSFAKPRIAIDWQAALKQQAATELREKLGVSEDTVREKREELRGKVKEELNKALGEDLSKGLQGLFGKKPAPAPPPPEPQPEPAPETKPQ